MSSQNPTQVDRKAETSTEFPHTDSNVADLDLRKLAEPDQLIAVYIGNAAPIGGRTQLEQFTVKETEAEQITGIDETWGDTVTITRTNDHLHLQSGGKSGEILRIEQLETTDEGIPIHGKETTVYKGSK